MLILALFTITKTWKQPEIHLLTDEWIKKVWNVYVCVYIYIICSVTKCSTLCDPTDYSTPGFPVLHYLQEFAQTHVHWVSDAIHSSCLLLPPFSSCPQSFPASGSFQISQFFTSGGQTIGASASVSGLPMSIKGWFSLGWTGWISLQSKGFSRVFSNTTVKSINSLALSFLYSPTLTFVHDYWKTIDLIRQTFVGK